MWTDDRRDSLDAGRYGRSNVRSVEMEINMGGLRSAVDPLRLTGQ